MVSDTDAVTPAESVHPTRIELSWPSISVVIPAHNEQAELPRCLRSLDLQDYRGRVEVIVVDNASDDATASIARSAGAQVVTEPTRGVCHARQAGTAVATGDIVVSSDADTTFPSTWLTRIALGLLDNPDAVATCGPCRFVDAPWWGSLYTGVVFGVTNLVYRRTRRVLYASATNIAFRRTAWNGYDTRLTQGGDELGLLRDLRGRGPVLFDPARVTSTSARRLRRGLVYNLFVTCLFFYIGAYSINRITGRTLLGNAPVIRSGEALDAVGRHRWRVTVPSLVAFGLALAWWLSPVDIV